MTVISSSFILQTQGKTEIIDISEQVRQRVSESGILSGIVTIFIAGSTAGLTTIEYEPGLIMDFQALWKRIAPEEIPYDHNERWGDGNGYSHVRASLLGASLTVPFMDKKLSLGTWQQIVLVDFDNRSRSRQIILQIIGE
jgi:secondary thiamine-phosphate synthase enzyme